MALKIKRNKERRTISHNKFRIDSTKVISKACTHYEIELEVIDDNCEFKLLELTMESIRPSAASQLFKLINKLVPSLDLRGYRFPKPVDMTIKDLARNYALGGSISLKLDGTRSFLACYEANVYAISIKGEDTIIESGVSGCNLLTLLDTETVNGVYYAFDIVILNGVVVANQPLKEMTRMVPQVCLTINNSTKRRLVVAKRHFMFKTFSVFSRQHQILENQIQESKYDGLIYTHSQSYFDPIMRWKPQKTIDLLYQEKTLMAYNKTESVYSKLKMSQDSKEPRENVVSEFIINFDGSVTLLRERRDKIYPNSITVVERIGKIKRDERNMFNIFKGLTVSMMRSYHNDVKKELLKKGSGHLLDIGSGLGGDITKWNHYKSITCIDPSHTNIKELKRRLGANKKVRVIQTKVEHLRGLERSITTLSCFFCITLVDIEKFVKVVQRTLSDKHRCVFLCTIMSKKYVTEFFKTRKIREYTCEAYSIRLESDSKICIHIPDTIVINQTENLVDVDKLVEQFVDIGFKLETRNRLDRDKFMSSNERLLSCMYESLTMIREKRV